jgi:hypothetical protein
MPAMSPEKRSRYNTANRQDINLPERKSNPRGFNRALYENAVQYSLISVTCGIPASNVVIGDSLMP